MKVPQLSPWVGKEEYAAIASCFDNNWITEGPKSKEFAQKLLELIGSRYGVFAPNGTLALYLGLKAIGVGPGDEVIVPDFTFIASGTSIHMAGATPVFVDVNKRNFQIDLGNADRLVSKKTKAIMPVHIYGTICNMDKVMEFARKYKLAVIEDAAEAIDVRWKGKHSGTFGEVGCFSFFADKTITTGEGGFVVTDEEKIYENLLYLRNQGRIDRGSFIHPQIGYNFRMTDIQNAIGLVQLSKLEEIKKRKLHILALYQRLLKDIKDVKFFEPEDGAQWLPFRMVILCEKASELMAFMKEREIEPRTFFYPLHSQPAFSYLKGNKHKYEDSEFPNAIYGYEHGVCLPIFPTLTDAQVEYVCETIKEFQGRYIFYKYYDVIFKEKDYSSETQLVFDLAQKYGLGEPKKVLEIGCGTGNHTKFLARKVSKLLAIDIDPKMIEVASKKLAKVRAKNVKFVGNPVEEIEDHGFDLALALFNVVTYIAEPKKLASFMRGVFRVLKPGGIFVFDCWNGVAAVLDPPKSKRTVVKSNGKRVESNLSSKTDFLNQLTTLNYNITISNGKTVEKGVYTILQTLWMPREIISAVKNAGLEIVLSSPFGQPDKPVTDKDWKIMFCVRKPISQ